MAIGITGATLKQSSMAGLVSGTQADYRRQKGQPTRNIACIGVGGK